MKKKWPDLTEFGYRIEEVLGGNPEGGRTAYRATNTGSGETVVIKRFSFASDGADWEGYEAHERELEMLEELKHPRIPAYLGNFQTSDGFCLVQEFCPAPSMASRKSWSPEQVHALAHSILEILVFLQNRMPPIVHRDIKPENILVDDQGNANLVDFGLARADRATATTMAVGTPGYMPPEQLLGQEVTEATDLYAVGASLLSALTGTPSNQIGSLVSSSFEFDLSRLPDNVSPAFESWLERMLAPDLKRRFNSAEEALQALESVGSITRSRAPHQERKQPRKEPARSPTRDPDVAQRDAAHNDTSPSPSWDSTPKTPVGTRASLVTMGVGLAIAGFVVGIWVYTSGNSDEITGTRDRTLVCNSEMTISDNVEMTQPSWAIQAVKGCDLTITNANIIGRKHGGILIKGGKVTIDNSKFNTSGSAIEMSGPGTVTVKNSTLTATGQNSRGMMLRQGTAVVTGTDVEGNLIGISVTRNGVSLDLAGSSVKGNKFGLSIFGGETSVHDSTLESRNLALKVERGSVDLGSGVTLKGGVEVTPGSHVSGLDDSNLKLGAAAEKTWVNMTCAPIMACVEETGSLGEYIVDLRATIGEDGTVAAPEFLQVKLAPPAKACVEERITGLEMPDHDGKKHTVRCTTNGNLMAGGGGMQAVDYRME